MPGKLVEHLGPTGAPGMESQTPGGGAGGCLAWPSPLWAGARGTCSELCPFIASFRDCANASIAIRPIELERKKKKKMENDAKHDPEELPFVHLSCLR